MRPLPGQCDCPKALSIGAESAIDPRIFRENGVGGGERGEKCTFLAISVKIARPLEGAFLRPRFQRIMLSQGFLSGAPGDARRRGLLGDDGAKPPVG